MATSAKGFHIYNITLKPSPQKPLISTISEKRNLIKVAKVKNKQVTLQSIPAQVGKRNKEERLNYKNKLTSTYSNSYVTKDKMNNF